MNKINQLGGLRFILVGFTYFLNRIWRLCLKNTTDMKVKLWNIATRQELATFPVIVEFPTLSFSPDGDTLAIGEMTGDNRRIQLLRAPSFEEIAAEEAKRNLAGRK